MLKYYFQTSLISFTLPFYWFYVSPILTDPHTIANGLENNTRLHLDYGSQQE